MERTMERKQRRRVTPIEKCDSCAGVVETR